MKYSKAGVALTLTPHLDALVAEASRFASRFSSPLTLIHVGTSQAESSAYLTAAADRVRAAHAAKVLWNQFDPAEAVMTAAATEKIDLLVVGAFEGPAMGRRRFLGSVAQALASRAECSLFLVAHPRVENHRFKRIVAFTDFSKSARFACEEALRVAESDEAESFHIVSIHTVFMEARARLGPNQAGRTYAEEVQLMDEFVASLPAGRVAVEGRVLRGTTGFVGCDFADSVEADLLVLPGHHRGEGRITPMIDWTLRVLPCSLWIVHRGPVWSRYGAASGLDASPKPDPLDGANPDAALTHAEELLRISQEVKAKAGGPQNATPAPKR